MNRGVRPPPQWYSTPGIFHTASATRGKVNNISTLQQAPLSGSDAVAPRCHPHGVTAMSMLIVCLLLLAQQGKGDTPGDGVESLVGYRTSFSCVGRVAGYYADVGSGCQMYHMCDTEGRRFTHTCPNATLFQQRMMICDHWYMVNCNNSEHDYSANLLIGQRDKPFVSSEEHLHHREPVNFFRVQQSPGTLQQPNWFPVIGDRIEQHAADIENAVPNSGHQIPAVHISYQPPDIESALPPPSANRRARNRNINTENTSQPRVIPQVSTSGSVSTTSRPVLPSGTKSNSHVYSPETFPDTYRNNLFFQFLLLRTAPSTPQPLIEISKHSDNLKLRENPTAQLDGHQTFTKSRKSAPLDELGSTPRALSQQSNRRTKEISIRLGSSQGQNHPENPRYQKLSHAYTSDPFLESLTKTKTLQVPPSGIDEEAITQINNENEDDENTIVKLHLLDPRRMFFIPESDEKIAKSNNYDSEPGNSTVLFISLPVAAHRDHTVMLFRPNVQGTEGRNPDCPRCHPGFLRSGTCQPCVIIR